MIERLIQLVVLFAVIIDPLASFAVFFASTQGMPVAKKRKIAGLALLLAAGISFLFLFFGQKILYIFSTNLDDFRVAGGLILAILGSKMALGTSVNVEGAKGNSAQAIAAIIATPLLSGPACITAILISVHDYGMLIPGLAIGIVLAMTAFLFLFSVRFHKFINQTAIQVTSTVMGLITLAWGVNFIRAGLGF